MRRTTFLTFGLLFYTSFLFSQNLQPPVDYGITSDYGPRDVGYYDWHYGIDYGSPRWTPVEAVDGGNVDVIRYDAPPQGGGTAGWYIRIDGSLAYWTYMHLFYDSNNPVGPSPDNSYEARMATLVNPETGEPNPSQPVYVFIFWVNRDNNRAEKVLSAFSNRWVRTRPQDPGYNPNNPYILDENGERILGRGSVTDNEVIAPSGNSGNMPQHLHLSAGSRDDIGPYYDINSLYYVQHDTPSYTFDFLVPEENSFLYHIPGLPYTQQTHERVKVYINSTEGKDLDKAKLYLFVEGEEQIFDDSHLLKRIIYGGLPPSMGEAECFPNYINVRRGSYQRTGIAPRPTTLCGEDTVYFVDFNTKVNWSGGGDARIHSEARFSDGNYQLVTRTHSIRDVAFSVTRNVRLDNFIPYVKQVEIEQQCWEPLRYKAYWGDPIDEHNLGGLIDDEAPGLCYSGMVTIFTITFSERMRTDAMPSLTVELAGGVKTVPSGHWLDDSTYEAATEESFFTNDDEGDATLKISTAQDLANNVNDGYPKTIAYRDEQGHWLQYEDPPDDNYKFWINGPPQVVSTDPPSERGRDRGAEDVDIYKKVSITFNKTMDTASVRNALEIMNLDDSVLVQINEINWEGDDKTMIIRVHDPVVMDDTTGFQFFTKYQVKIKGTAEDTLGATLDGDKDGKSEGSPADDDTFSFKTRSPEFELSLDPWLSKVELGRGRTINVVVKNLEARILKIRLEQLIGSDANWTIDSITPDTVIVAAKETSSEAYFAVRNNGEPGSIRPQVKGTCCKTEKVATALVWASEHYEEPNPPSHGLDENYSISNPHMPSPWLLNPYAKVGILLSGYAEGMGHLLGKYKISTAIVLDNFDILGASDRQLSDLDVLVIPSGGLIPYHNLPPFRNKLQEYTEQGGTLICFTQSHGDVFEALPGSPRGYGWREDQSCWQSAGYFSYWDVILSGQDDIVHNGNNQIV